MVESGAVRLLSLLRFEDEAQYLAEARQTSRGFWCRWWQADAWKYAFVTFTSAGFVSFFVLLWRGSRQVVLVAAVARVVLKAWSVVTSPLSEKKVQLPAGLFSLCSVLEHAS